ncbi:MAG: hypothetical protein M3336_06995, partial [Chloroflexota bacterium]|nr:hypothetical protein [Chloroflexota bacterium]
PVRGRLLGWLAEGAREVHWALCSLRRERWAAAPPPGLGPWPALRHVRYLVLSDRCLTLPAVGYAFGEDVGAKPSTAALEQADAAWDPVLAAEAADELIDELAAARFELLRRLESAPDSSWRAPLAADVLKAYPAAEAAPPRLADLLLRARQRELEHLASLWRIALYWDHVVPAAERSAPAGSVGLRLHPADRLEESH